MFVSLQTRIVQYLMSVNRHHLTYISAVTNIKYCFFCFKFCL